MTSNSPSRLLSLDAFRGATMLLMVLVNNPGSGKDAYAPLRHAQWNGWTLTDTIFPSFVWIVGVAITLSLGRRLETGKPRASLIMPVLRRAAILFAIGLFIYLFPSFDFPHMRVLGVLQRIAICYAIASVVFLYTGVRGQILFIIGLFASYAALMTFAIVPGYGSGAWDIEHNFAHYVDSIALGAHNFQWTQTWDPEGIISTLPSIATALLGVLAGQILRLRTSLMERIVPLMVTGSLLVFAALASSHWMPINKKLWTVSFVLLMAGLDFVAFGIALWLVDVRGHKQIAQPLIIVGMNALVVYVASELLPPLLDFGSISGRFYKAVLVPIVSPANASLLYALIYTSLMFALAYVMYRRCWFVKL